MISSSPGEGYFPLLQQLTFGTIVRTYLSHDVDVRVDHPMPVLLDAGQSDASILTDKIGLAHHSNLQTQLPLDSHPAESSFNIWAVSILSSQSESGVHTSISCPALPTTSNTMSLRPVTRCRRLQWSRCSLRDGHGSYNVK